MEDPIKEDSIQLINFKENNELEMTEDGINFLTNLKKNKVFIFFINRYSSDFDCFYFRSNKRKCQHTNWVI